MFIMPSGKRNSILNELLVRDPPPELLSLAPALGRSSSSFTIMIFTTWHPWILNLIEGSGRRQPEPCSFSCSFCAYLLLFRWRAKMVKPSSAAEVIYDPSLSHARQSHSRASAGEFQNFMVTLKTLFFFLFLFKCLDCSCDCSILFDLRSYVKILMLLCYNI